MSVARQLASHWRVNASSQSQLASQRHAVSGISPVARQPASNWREHFAAARFSQNSQHIKEKNEGIWGRLEKHDLAHLQGTSWRLEELEEPWDFLGIKWGSLERFGYSSFVVVYLLPSFSYLFNELLHSFRVCFIYIYV